MPESPQDTAGGPPPLAEFNDAGVGAFATLLVEAADGLPAPAAAARALTLARDRRLTDPVPGGPPVDPAAPFADRAELADLTLALLKDAGVAAGPEAHRVGLWTWLAAVWLPRLCGRAGDGPDAPLDVKEPVKYVLSLETQKFYRHLVAGPAWLRHLHGDRARLFLSQKPYYHPDVAEQVVGTAQAEYAGLPEVVRLIDRLYWDPDARAPKVRATNRGGKNEPHPPGVLRALLAVLGQIGCTHDLPSLSADRLLAMLPAEFDRFRDDRDWTPDGKTP